MGVADLVQTLEMGKKSGVLHLHARTGTRGTCWLSGGRVVDCELTGAPAGEEAFYRILRWREGGFAIEFGPVVREARIELPTQALLLQGMRRIDDWGRAVEQLPPLDRRLEVDVARLGERLARLPDDANGLLRLFDGRRTLAQVLEASPQDDVATAEAVARLVADEVLKEAAGGAEAAPDEVPAAAPAFPAPDPGGVDWFAGPVGPAAAAPELAPLLASAAAEPAPSPDAGGAWLQPPLEPRAAAAAGAPRPALRFSIPVPPPGSLPPPPSVAETLARYQVVPRPRRAPAPEQVAGDHGATAKAGPQALPAAPSSPAPSTPKAAPEPGPPPATTPPPATGARSEASAVTSPEAPAAVTRPGPPSASAGPPPAAAAPPAPAPGAGGAAAAPPSELVRRLSGAPAGRRRDPGSVPVHLEAERVAAAPAAPRRSAVPYLALGGVLLAAIMGGTALTRRPVLRPAPAPAPAVESTPPEPTPAEVPAPASPDRQVVAAPEPAPPARPASVEAAAAPPIPAPSPAAAPSAPASTSVAAAAVPTAAVPTPASPTPAGGGGGAAAAPAASEEPDPRKLLAAADRKYAAGRYAEAVADYRRAIAQRSTPAAHVALARALYDGHRSAEALQELEGVIAASPRDASAWLLRGDIHQGEGHPAEAREAYQRFLELQPDGEQASTVRSILEREQQ